MNQADRIKALRSMGLKRKPDDSVTIDKAKYHFESVSNAGLDQIQAYVPGSFLMGWLVDNSLVTEEVETGHKDRLLQFRNREISAAHLFTDFDGVLNSDLTIEIGAKFLAWYERKFFSDYDETLCLGLEGDRQYEVTDSWDNYSKLSELFDRRFFEFQKSK